jgi:hypothetical protein
VAVFSCVRLAGYDRESENRSCTGLEKSYGWFLTNGQLKVSVLGESGHGRKDERYENVTKSSGGIFLETP